MGSCCHAWPQRPPKAPPFHNCLATKTICAAWTTQCQPHAGLTPTTADTANITASSNSPAHTSAARKVCTTYCSIRARITTTATVWPVCCRGTVVYRDPSTAVSLAVVFTTACTATTHLWPAAPAACTPRYPAARTQPGALNDPLSINSRPTTTHHRPPVTMPGRQLLLHPISPMYSAQAVCTTQHYYQMTSQLQQLLHAT
jgi:hypothetical protein